MCGLTAVYYTETTTRPDSSEISELLSASLAKIQHRGPDYTGVWVSPDCSVGLGHVRLSIIDLDHGQQPLSDENERIHCVVTGEIYDHERIRDELIAQGFTFKTKSDSELVVQLYKRDGLDLLSSLRGEFAFVLYDSTRRLMLAARDRFGIKPLYYTISDGRLLIASEMKAFLAFGWKAKWDIDSVVHNGDLGDDRTVFKGVNKLMAGHSLVFRPTGYLKVQSYWDITYSNIDTPNVSTVDEMISNVRAHLFDAIRLRLRSDVPVGVYLSGGIDSAAIAGMAMHLLRQNNPDAKLATFTLAFPDAGDNDEGPIAHRTAIFLGAEEHMVNITEKELVDSFEATLWHVEQPIWAFHAPGKYLLSKFVQSQGYKVVLSGEGADEFLGGYAWLPVDYLRQPDSPGLALGLELPTDTEREAMLNRIQMATVPVFSLSKNSYTDVSLARKMLGGISAHRAYAAATSAGAELYNSRAIAVAGEPDVPRAIAEGIDPSVRNKAVSGEWHPLNVASYVTAKTILMKSILNHMGERMEMAHSVEGRPPFLDHNFIEYVNTIPPSLKVRPIKNETSGTWAFTEKWILRQAVKPYVTEEVFLRRKLSYNAPPSRRTRGESLLVPLQAHLKVRITRANVERVGFLDWSFVEGLLAGYLTNPNFPADGSLDARAQLLLYVLSFIVLQERFDVPTWNN
ncbi:Asparagine synthetase domain-containing protein [Mycena sanguinolenta]|uniref:Asparagine synthetase domain-containing protein n=1 Tax=Mycena sanguinolenta TaxID=230812 RepID=A0A8H6Y091_9AGAR|nr:Asparagine synthetase domain-containing protein [Mycena sanguinolenta]